MGLSAQQRADVEKRILHFIGVDFFESLSRYYAAAVAYAGKHPENINNELRNAITHFGRALRADDIDFANAQIAKANSHIERFKRDCLKVGVIFAGRDISRMVKHAHIRFSRIDPRIHARITEIVTEKMQTVVLEALGDHNAKSWENIFDKTIALRNEVIAAYPELDPEKHWFPKWCYPFFRWTINVLGGLAIAFIAGVLLIVAIPDSTKFGQEARKVVGAVVHMVETVLDIPLDDHAPPDHGK